MHSAIDSKALGDAIALIALLNWIKLLRRILPIQQWICTPNS